MKESLSCGVPPLVVHLFESEIKLLVIMTIPYNTAHMGIQENEHQHYCKFTHVATEYIASYSYMTLCACAW